LEELRGLGVEITRMRQIVDFFPVVAALKEN